MPDYEILGVDPSSSDEQLKAARKRQIKKNHPDLSDDPKAATARIIAINEAFDRIMTLRLSERKQGGRDDLFSWSGGYTPDPARTAPGKPAHTPPPGKKTRDRKSQESRHANPETRRASNRPENHQNRQETPQRNPFHRERIKVPQPERYALGAWAPSKIEMDSETRSALEAGRRYLEEARTFKLITERNGGCYPDPNEVLKFSNNPLFNISIRGHIPRQISISVQTVLMELGPEPFKNHDFIIIPRMELTSANRLNIAKEPLALDVIESSKVGGWLSLKCRPSTGMNKLRGVSFQAYQAPE